MGMAKVVRCADCQFGEDLPRGIKKYCRILDVTMRPDDYCSRGMDKGNIFSPSNPDGGWRGGQALDLAKYIVTKCAQDEKQIEPIKIFL